MTRRSRTRPESLVALRAEMELRFGELAVYASSWLQPVLFEVLERPLSRPRWRVLSRRFNGELLRRAEAKGTSAERELHGAARQALSLAVPELEIPGRLMEEDGRMASAYALRELRRRISELVTRDLLGLDWRQPGKPSSEEPASPRQRTGDIVGPSSSPFTTLTPLGRFPSPMDDLEAAETARELLDALSAQEREVFHLVAQGIPTEEAAAAMAASPGAARVLLHRFRGKARRVLGLRKKPRRSKKPATT